MEIQKRRQQSAVRTSGGMPGTEAGDRGGTCAPEPLGPGRLGWFSWVFLMTVSCFLLLGCRLRAYASETEAYAPGAEESVSGAQVPIDGAESTEAGTEAWEEEADLPDGRSAYNILLVGSDHRDTSWNGNSDVMIVATVNEEKETIYLTSFMRDLWADIPGYGVHKLNYAYAAGGAETLMETLEDNYRLEIDNYAVVDFETMAEIIDLVGGVEIEVSDAECVWLNGYLDSMGASGDALPGGGAYTLNGNQAVAYMRIRFVGNNDYERTQRQRDVLKQIFASMQELPPQKFASLALEALTCVDHDISFLQMGPIAAMMAKAIHYDLEENRIPYDGLYSSENEMLVPDFPATISRLHETLYGEEPE